MRVVAFDVGERRIGVAVSDATLTLARPENVLRPTSLAGNGLQLAIDEITRLKGEEDGVAMSSRNMYLGPKQRKDASCLITALRRAEDMVNNGESSAARVSAEMKRLIDLKVDGLITDYPDRGMAVLEEMGLKPR